MAADTAGFRIQFPEFDSSANDEQVSLALQEARLIHSRRALATLYCAAHILKLSQNPSDTNTPGEISSATVGPMTTTYKTQAEKNWQSFFTRTEYGRHFLILEQRTARSGIGAMVIRG